jgi:hypothetical protein
VTAREAARRRRVTVCDPTNGNVSPLEIGAYLIATGWRRAAVACTEAQVFAPPGARKRPEIDLFDDLPAEDIVWLIRDIAKVEKRKPSEVLRAIEAHAATEKRRT